MIDKVKSLCYTSILDMEVGNLKSEQFSNDKRQIELSGNSHGIGFLYKKIDAPRLSLTYWIDIPEFVDAITNLLDEGHTIGNNEVFQIMKDIYLEKNNKKRMGHR